MSVTIMRERHDPTGATYLWDVILDHTNGAGKYFYIARRLDDGDVIYNLTASDVAERFVSVVQ